MVWLDSKTTIPHATPEAVERQRLFNVLRYSGPRKLTIVRAPAGYGKTTLLSQWISQFDEPVVWLSIDAMDNDPSDFGNMSYVRYQMLFRMTLLHYYFLFSMDSPHWNH